MKYLGWVLLLWMPVAWAECVTVPAVGVERDLRQAFAYSLAYQAGYDVIPHAPDGLQVGQSQSNDICFDGVKANDISNFLSDQIMLDSYTAEQNAQQAALTVDQQKQTQLNTDIKSLALSDLKASQDKWDTLPDTDRLILGKKLLDIEIARRELQ